MILVSRIFSSIVIIGLLIIFTHCEDDYIMGGPYWGSVSAKKNGEYWKGSIRGIKHNQLIGFQADKHNQEGFLRESFSITKIPMTPGNHEIPFTDTLNIYNNPTAAYFTLQDDGDVIEGVYYVDPNAVNFINIQSNSIGVFKGTFGITFLVLPSSKDRYPFLPDKVIFTNGQFETKILIQI